MARRVAIVGTGPGCEHAPFGDPAWEVWGLNDLYRLIPGHGAARWWELHGDTPLTRARRAPDHFDRIAALGIPVYYLQGNPPAPLSVKYPLEQAIAIGRDYFACTAAYQIALTLLEGVNTIGLWGTPLQYGREVVVERPCVSWWLGLAEGRGVEVIADRPQPIGLLHHPFRYALEDAHEREAVFHESQAVAHTLVSWLPQEAARLAPCPKLREVEEVEEIKEAHV